MNHTLWSDSNCFIIERDNVIYIVKYSLSGTAWIKRLGLVHTDQLQRDGNRGGATLCTQEKFAPQRNRVY